MSQYQILLAWFGKLPSRNENSRKYDCDDQTSSTMDASLSTKKAKHVKDSTLAPVAGSLRARLNSDYHYIEPSKSLYPVCALCRWAHTSSKDGDFTNSRVCGRIVGSCDKCTINLCLSCFKVFHTISTVNKLKSEVLNRKEE